MTNFRVYMFLPKTGLNHGMRYYKQRKNASASFDRMTRILASMPPQGGEVRFEEAMGATWVSLGTCIDSRRKA